MKASIGWAILPLTLAAASPALAQDFGTRWRDRVGQELREEEDILSARPLVLALYGGVLYFFDNNIFLSDSDPRSDAILAPYVNLRLDYAEPQFDAVIDAIANYSAYLSNSSASAGEVRFFGRGRYITADLELELADAVRYESEPIDVIFASRTSRVVNNAMPRASVELSPDIRLEGQADFQTVHFEDSDLRILDNLNYRAGITIYFRLSETNVLFLPPETELLLDGGFLAIDYLSGSSPAPDAAGYYVRSGLRLNALTETLHVILIGGYTSVKSDDFPGTTTDAEHRTADFLIAIRFQATESIVLRGDYTRRFGFSVAGPFQVNDLVVGHALFQAAENITLWVRAQYDRSHTALGVVSDFFSMGIGGEFQISPHLLIPCGFTYRQGAVLDGAPHLKFEGVIFHIGIEGSY